MRTFCFHTEDEIGFESSHIEELAAALKRARPAKTSLGVGLRFQDVAEKLIPVLGIEPILTSVIALESVAIETWELAKTYTIKFQQKYQSITVYGALVSVEVDENEDLLAINSIIGIPEKVDISAKIQYSDIEDLIKSAQGDTNIDSRLTPTKYFYFDLQQQIWRLVYYVDNKVNYRNAEIKFELIPQMVDYIIDAHTGEIISQLPRYRREK
jgi:Zn-dependent metalloprotease